MRWILGLLLLASTAAHAGDDDEARARELFDNGSTLYEEGAYADAIEAFQAAYDLSKRPLLLFNIASAYEKLGELQSAVDTLNRYRAFATADERDILEMRIRNLQKRIDAAAPEPTPAPEPKPNPVANPDHSEHLAHAPHGPGLAGPIVLYSVSGLGLGTGTVFALRASAARKELAARCQGTLCSEGAGAWVKQDRSASTLADVGFVVGALGAGVGTALLLRSSRTSAWAAPMPGGLLIGGRL